jgi:uncharacterized protein (TIGR03118 family)
MIASTIDRMPTVLAAGLLLVFSVPVDAAVMVGVTTLVSDEPGDGLQDANLLNPWGVSHSPTGPIWVSDNGTGVSTVYTVDAATDATTKASLTVSIPNAGSVTGQVFNGDASAFNGDAFVFVSEDGTVSGWRPALGSSAETLVSPSSASYKGAAIGATGGYTYLYGANFAAGSIDVVKGSAAAPDLASNFTDPNLPSGYSPFNVQQLGGQLFVAYAQRDAQTNEEIAGPGLGIVDRFALDGSFIGRVGSGGTLNAPWGLALAPAAFGDIAGQLLVGNFGDGMINVYNLTTNSANGQLVDGGGLPVAIDGLWALAPGNGGSAGSADRIYFTAGPDEESHGRFGVISPVPLPSAIWLMGAAVAALGPWRRRRIG